MAKRTHTWYTVLVKLFTGIVAIMGIAVMAVCAYDMVQTMQDATLEKKIEKEIYLIETTNSYGYVFNGHRYSLNDKDKYTMEGIDANKTESKGLERFEGARTYRFVLMLCLVCGVILGFVQLVSSIGIVCNCHIADIPRKVKTWLVISTLIFLLGSLCVIVPLSYNVENGTHFNVKGFSDYVKSKFVHLVESHTAQKFHDEIFFYTFGINEGLLLVCIILLGGLLPCATSAYESPD